MSPRSRAIACAAFIAACVTAACSERGPQGGASSAISGGDTRGILRIASQQQPDAMSPLQGQQFIDTDLSMLWASYLFLWNDKDQLVPDLAVAVPSKANHGISADGRTITYRLRKGVLWQDGAPLTAADVLFSWRQIMNPRNITGTTICYALIQRIDTPDPHTLIVHLLRPYSPFVDTFFSMSSEAYSILPKHVLDKYSDLNDVPFDKLPIGTGPFRVIENDQLKRIRFVANDRYWRGRPNLKEIDFEWVPDDRTLVKELTDHRIDLYLESAQALEPQLHGIPGTTIYLYPFTRFADIGFNLARPGLRDRGVREALAFATDRRSLVDRVSNGVNVPTDTDQPPGSWAHSDRITHYPYNPRRAAAMFDALGWRIGRDGVRQIAGRALSFVMVGEAGSATALAAEIEIAREWREVGVRLTIKNYPSAELYAPRQQGGIQQNGRFDVTFEQWGNGVDPDDSQLFACDQAPPAGWNIYNFCDPALDAVELKATTDYDRSLRRADYAAIQRILAVDLPMLPVWFVQRQDVANIDLRGYRPTSAISPLWNSWEWRR